MSSDKQPASTYPEGFIVAVLPGDVTTSFCEHEADPPVCHCVHDWRIEWGQVEKVVSRSNLQSDGFVVT